MDLSSYDIILANSSAGKDSQAMLDVLVAAAAEAGVTDRIVVVHCDLGKVEWGGTKELAERQAQHYGLRFETVSNRNWDDLLARIEARGKWPDAKNRYCTSEFKTGQVKRLTTALVAEALESRRVVGRPVRVLNCLGIRAAESASRAKRPSFHHLEKKTGWSNGKRHVDEWLPIHDWSLKRVWDRINASGVEHHNAYDLGMPRLSCVFCVFASKSALLIAAKANPWLAREYAGAEKRMGHTFRQNLSMAQVVQEAETATEIVAEDWSA